MIGQSAVKLSPQLASWFKLFSEDPSFGWLSEDVRTKAMLCFDYTEGSLASELGNLCKIHGFDCVVQALADSYSK